MPPSDPNPRRRPSADMEVIDGLPVSGGIAIGRAVVLEKLITDVYRFPVEGAVEPEIERFHQAVDQAKEEVGRLRDETVGELGEQLGAIFEAHLLVLGDPGFLAQVEERIRDERVNAEWAVHRTAEEYFERFSALDNAYLRERRTDLEDVVHHVLRRLHGIAHHDLSDIQGPVVIVADDLTPSEAVRMGRDNVVGFAIEIGGRTSHTAIIAKSLNLPAVIGLGEVTSLVTDEDPVVIDGERGQVILHPTPGVLAAYRRRIEDLASREAVWLETRDLPARTRDDVAVTLMANIDLAEELVEAQRFGATGIGLYRSEFLYIEKSPELPTEEDHLEVYRSLLEAAAPEPAIIRTYDLGGRKLAQELLDSREENPVLGLRGIRLTLARPKIFETQLRALFRASVHGELWIMVPLVSNLDEVRRFQAYAASIREQLDNEGHAVSPDTRIGVMIEVPSAALIADAIAREVDFLSIGTNDLIQYSLAVDRNNEQVADLYQPFHPAILRMLRSVIDAGRAADIEVSLCGEMAADPRSAALLVGLGMRRLSMTPRQIPVVKTHLRQLVARDLERVADRAVTLATAGEVEELLDELLESMPEAPDALLDNELLEGASGASAER